MRLRVLLPVSILTFVGLCGVAHVQAQRSIVAIGDANAAPGMRVQLPLVVTRTSEISSVQFVLSFDSEVVTLDENSLRPGPTLDDHAFSMNFMESSVAVVIHSNNLSPFKNDNLTLVDLDVVVSDSAQLGTDTFFELSDLRGVDREGNSIEVRPVRGTLHITDDLFLPYEGLIELLFPQIANGGGIAVLMVLVNRSGTATNAVVQFFRSDGTPFQLSLTDGRVDSSFLLTVPAGGSVFLASDGTGDATVGYARMSSTFPLGAVLLFTIRDEGGKALAEAGVTASPKGRRFSVPALLSATSDTGLAIANISADNASVTLILKDEMGIEVDRVDVELEAGFHTARFLTQFFAEALEGTEDFEGSVEVSSIVPVTAIALKQEGLLLTTFPVVELPEEILQ